MLRSVDLKAIYFYVLKFGAVKCFHYIFLIKAFHLEKLKVPKAIDKVLSKEYFISLKNSSDKPLYVFALCNYPHKELLDSVSV